MKSTRLQVAGAGNGEDTRGNLQVALWGWRCPRGGQCTQWWEEGCGLCVPLSWAWSTSNASFLFFPPEEAHLPPARFSAVGTESQAPGFLHPLCPPRSPELHYPHEPGCPALGRGALCPHLWKSYTHKRPALASPVPTERCPVLSTCSLGAWQQ